MENQKKVFDTIRKSCLLFFKFCWISHLSPIKFPTLSSDCTFFNFSTFFHFSGFLDFQIFQIRNFSFSSDIVKVTGHFSIWLWTGLTMKCSKFLGFDPAKTFLHFSVFWFSKFLSVELKCFPHYKIDGTFLRFGFKRVRLRSVQNSCDMIWQLTCKGLEFLLLFPVFDFSNFVFLCFPQANWAFHGYIR